MKVKIREATFNDFNRIKKLFIQYNMRFKDYSFQEWEHIWKNNPVVQKLSGHWPIGWVIEHEHNIVGYLGNIPIAYELNGKRIIGASMNSWVVNNSFRMKSILLLHAFINQNLPDLFLNTTADKAAGKVFAFYKGEKVPHDTYDQVLFWIVNYQKVVLSYLIKKNIFPRSLSYPLGFIIKIFDKLRRKNIFQHERSDVRFCQSFNKTFDKFWENLRKTKNLLLAVRNLQALSWHFSKAIHNGTLWVFYKQQNQGITSYAIFIREDNKEIGLVRVRLVDFQLLDNTYEEFGEFLASARKKCIQENIDIIEVIGFNNKKRSIMEKYFPYIRRLPNWPFYYRINNASLNDFLQKQTCWDPCSYDGDGSL